MIGRPTRNGALPDSGTPSPNPWDLPLSRQNDWITLETLERRIGLRRDATRAPIPGPEWHGAALQSRPKHSTPRPRRTLTYCGQKMVLTMGSTIDLLQVYRLGQRPHRSGAQLECKKAKGNRVGVKEEVRGSRVEGREPPPQDERPNANAKDHGISQQGPLQVRHCFLRGPGLLSARTVYRALGSISLSKHRKTASKSPVSPTRPMPVRRTRSPIHPSGVPNTGTPACADSQRTELEP